MEGEKKYDNIEDTTKILFCPLIFPFLSLSLDLLMTPWKIRRFYDALCFHLIILSLSLSLSLLPHPSVHSFSVFQVLSFFSLPPHFPPSFSLLLDLPPSPCTFQKEQAILASERVREDFNSLDLLYSLL